MNNLKAGAAILTLATFLGAAATTIAQSDPRATPSTTAVAVEDDRPNYTPLLGLLGLVGLMGLRRRNDYRDTDSRGTV